MSAVEFRAGTVSRAATSACRTCRSALLVVLEEPRDVGFAFAGVVGRLGRDVDPLLEWTVVVGLENGGSLEMRLFTASGTEWRDRRGPHPHLYSAQALIRREMCARKLAREVARHRS